MKPMNDKAKLKIARRAMQRVISLIDCNGGVHRSKYIVESESGMRQYLMSALSRSKPDES